MSVASEANDNSEFHTAAVNAADATDVNEAEAFKKPSGNLTAERSENKSLKKPLQDGRLTDKETESVKNPLQHGRLTDDENESLKNQLQSGRLTDQAVVLGPPAGLNQKQWNLVTAYNYSLWYVDSDDQEDKVKFLAAAVACQEHHEDDEDSS